MDAVPVNKRAQVIKNTDVYQVVQGTNNRKGLIAKENIHVC